MAAVIHAGGPTLGIAAGAGRIWVTKPSESNGHVLAIDPRTSRVVGPPIRVSIGPGQLAYGHGSLWVEDTAPLAINRIDPASGRASTPAGLAATLSTAYQFGAIATSYGSLFITANDHLTRFDPATGRVTANVRIPRGSEVATSAGSIWVLAEPRSTSPTRFYPIRNTARLWQVDPRTNETVDTAVPLAAVVTIAIAATGGHLWIAGPTTIAELRLTPGASRRRR